MTAFTPHTPDRPARPSWPRRALLATTLSLTLAGGIAGGAGLATAQDGTGAATPTPPSACKVVPVSTGDLASPSASPEVSPEASPMASPVGARPSAAPSASPVSLELESTADDALTQDLEAAATAIAGCLSDGNYETLATMTSDTYRGQLFGTNSPLDAATFAELAPALPRVAYQILSVEDATATGESTATATVTYEVSHQLRSGEWAFTQQEAGDETVWVLDSETAQPTEVPSGAASIDVKIGANAYTLSTSSVSGRSVALKGTNSDSSDHEMLVLRLADGLTTKDLLEAYGPSLPEGVAFIGQATIAAGSEGTLVLTGLQPGTYTIVCLLPDENGTPHLVNGMETTFTVK
jgi:plastocyanin